MAKHEKVRFILAVVLSIAFIISSVFVMDSAVDAIFSETSSQPTNIFGVILLGTSKLLMLFFGIGILSMGAIATFFAHSFRKHETDKIRKPMKSIFVSNLAFCVLDVLSLAVLLL